MSFSIETVYHFPIVIPDATAAQDGVMTKAQAAKLAGLLPGGAIAVYTNAARPAANTFPLGVASVIWNSTDHAPNYTDGINWYDAVGNLT